MRNRTRNSDDNFIIAMLTFVVGMACGMALLVAMSPAKMPAMNSTQGFPIRELNLSEDGKTLTFYIGDSQWQAVMKEAVSRPPNMALTSTVFVIGDELHFLNAENINVFGRPLRYTDSLQILQG